MTTRLSLSPIMVSACALLALAGPALADLKIGVTPGSNAVSVEKAAELAKAQGITVEVVEFSDWSTPNRAVAAGDLDANYFQHSAFLENTIAETGLDLVSAGTGVLGNIGLYSERYDSFDKIPEGAKVAVASDPVNQGRGLTLLQQAGLIKLDPSVGWKASLDDITENPRKLDFVEVEGPQLVRAISDVDLALGYPNHFVNLGRADFAGKALLYSGIDDQQFALKFVSRPDNRDDAELQAFIKLFQTAPEVRAVIDEAFAHNPALYTIAWETPAAQTAKVSQ